ncbi:hypothetical protein [Kitasatospora viridis]|uniref:Uncharacterized protein n=1 Tax=Kitasatospora viridis TaxID=281105 RepID=A0A561TSF2_9ACTN|nr:hypothetical protein [Kitasatospora viridis]TWF90045.1 hypothetical protein FHX73_1389 [Kitasatospora viridis]
MGDQELINIGRSIAQDLDRILGAAAAEVRPRLVELLDRAEAGEPVRAELVALLAERAELRRAVRSRQAGDQQYRLYDPLPGDPGAWAPPRYVCPNCDQEWYRFDAGEAVPRCDQHDVPLEPC